MECSYKNVSSKLGRSYYVMQSLKVTSVNTLRSMHSAKFHLHLRYRIVLGGGGMGNVKKMCKLQKKVMSLELCHPRCVESNITVYNVYVLTYTLYTVKVMTLISNIGRVTSCMEVFKTLNILPATYIYKMETVHYIKLNIGRFKQNSLRHHYNTHQ